MSGTKAHDIRDSPRKEDESDERHPGGLNEAEEGGIAGYQKRHHLECEYPEANAIQRRRKEPIVLWGDAFHCRPPDEHPADRVGDHTGNVVKQVPPGP